MSRRPIVEIQFEAGKRIIAISDIHGHLGLLDRLLAKVGFSEDDFLIVIGDAIEDGEASLGALRRVMELEKSGRARMLAGNWEHFMLEMLMSDDKRTQDMLLRRTLANRDYCGSSLLSDMCRELGIELAADSDLAQILPAVRENFGELFEYMASLPLMLDAGDRVFVHGGVPCFDRQVLDSLDEYDFLKNDAFAEQGHRFDRWLITGHWPVANYDRDIPRYSPHFFPEQRIAAIDGGCGKLQGAQLNALIMRAGKPDEFDWDFADDFKRVRALQPQQPSDDPLHTVWHTRFIDLVERGAEFSTVRHHDTGRMLTVPTIRLWQQAGADMLGDYTDYALPVREGDVLSVLFETSRGLCCKNGDISGWYFGEYEPLH